MQPQTEVLFHALRQENIPVIFFLNKTDRAGADPEEVYAQLRRLLSDRCVSMEDEEAAAEILCDADVDALVFDTFSNPSAEIIQERLFPFIEKIRSAHPDIPLVFQQTIYRERRNFDSKYMRREKEKQETAARLMKEACRKYESVYFIQTNATDQKHSTSVDGTHPNDYGYTLWAESIEKPLLKILRRHGIN